MTMDRRTLLCSTGSIEAGPGDRFRDHDVEWEITGWAETTSYSPFGLGGTPDVICKVIEGRMPSYYEEYANEDGTMTFCGDSIAANLMSAADGKPRGARGDLLRTNG
jgi:hypothetical protein